MPSLKRSSRHKRGSPDSAHHPPPDGGWGWWIVVASFGCNLVVDGIAYSFGVLLADLGDTFQSTRAQTSLVGSLLCGMYLLNAPISGLLVKRCGCRVVAMMGAVMAALSFLVSAYVNSLATLTFTYGGLAGFGFGFIYLPSIVSVGFWFERRRALATGIALSGSGIGTMVCSSLAKFCLESWGWRYTLVMLAAIVLQCAICGALLRPVPKLPATSPPSRVNQPHLLDWTQSDPMLATRKGQINDDNHRLFRSCNDIYNLTVMPVSRAQSDLVRKALFSGCSLTNIPRDEWDYMERPRYQNSNLDIEEPRRDTLCGVIKNVLIDMCDFRLLRHAGFCLVVLGNVFGMLGLYVPYVYLADRAVMLNVSAVQATLLISILGISNTIGRVISGAVSSVPHMTALRVNNLFLLGSAVATLLCPMCLTYPAMAIYAAAFGFFIAGYIALTPVILVDLMGLENLTSCFSILTLIRGVMAVLGTPIAGMIYDTTRSYDLSFYYGGCMLLLCTLLHSLLMLPCCAKWFARP